MQIQQSTKIAGFTSFEYCYKIGMMMSWFINDFLYDAVYKEKMTGTMIYYGRRQRDGTHYIIY